MKHFGADPLLTPALNPGTALLAKIGSLLMHCEEYLETSNPVDRQAMRDLRDDPDVKEWFRSMKALGLLPVKRSE